MIRSQWFDHPHVTSLLDDLRAAMSSDCAQIMVLCSAGYRTVRAVGSVRLPDDELDGVANRLQRMVLDTSIARRSPPVLPERQEPLIEGDVTGWLLGTFDAEIIAVISPTPKQGCSGMLARVADPVRRLASLVDLLKSVAGANDVLPPSGQPDAIDTGPLKDAAQNATPEMRALALVMGSDLLLNDVGNNVVVCDRDGRIIWVNQVFEQMTGYQLAEIEGKKPGSFMQCAQTDPQAIEQLSQAVEDKRSLRLIMLNQAKDGTHCWVDLSIQPIFDRDGHHVGFYSLQHDVTKLVAAEQQQRAANEALRQSEMLLEQITQLSDVGGWEIDMATGAMTVTRQMRHIHEIDPDMPISARQLWRTVCNREASRTLTKAYRKAITDRNDFQVELKLQTFQGRLHNVRLKVLPIFDEHGKLIKMFGAVRDITDTKMTHNALVEARDRAEGTLANLKAHQAALDQHSLVAMTDRDGKLTFVNSNFCIASGYRRDMLIGQQPSILKSGVHSDEMFDDMWESISSGGSWHGEICNRAKGGSIYWVDTTVVPIFDKENRIDGYVSISFDVTERKEIEEALAAELDHRKEAELLMRDVLNTVPDAVFAFDQDDRLAIYNKAFMEIYETSKPAIVIGASFEEIIRYGLDHGQYFIDFDKDDEKARDRWVAERLELHGNPGPTHIVQHKSGRWLQIRERLSTNGYTVGVRTDVTKMKETEAELKRLAEQDALTELANRAVLFQKLEALLEDGCDDHDTQHGALVLFDLDHFKDVNDTLGHDVGDHVLREMAARLKMSVRESDVTARLGGDEFASIILDPGDVQTVDQTFDRLHEALSEPMLVQGRSINPGVSIGITLFPRDGRDATMLFKNADIALYESKREGRGQWRFFDPSIKLHLDRRKSMIESLRTSIERQDFEIALQPQIDINNGAFRGFEILARWQIDGEIIPPGEFIPVAEDTGLIIPIGEIILDKSLSVFARMIDQGLHPEQISVNVAAAQLTSEGFLPMVQAKLQRYDIHPTQLEFEVTETVLLNRHGDRVNATLNALHEMGIALAMDDFGTGYASLTHIKQFPVDRIKVDQSFIRDINIDDDDAAIVRTMISLAHSLKLEVVAEGIEDEQQLAFLRQHRCDTGQGYFFARPLSDAAAFEFLQERQGHRPKAKRPRDGHAANDRVVPTGGGDQSRDRPDKHKAKQKTNQRSDKPRPTSVRRRRSTDRVKT